MRLTKELIVSVTPSETRVAVKEDERLVEFYLERARQPGLVGNIYKGRVETVIKGIRGAFINVGLRKNAFLPLAEVPGKELVGLYGPEAALKGGAASVRLAPGQELIVQVTKEPFGDKGARLTSYISLPGRYLVLLPNVPTLGVSRRIRDARTRARLNRVAEELGRRGMGFIIRTVAAQASNEEVMGEAAVLEEKWREVLKRAGDSTGPALLLAEVDLFTRVMRDLFDLQTRSLIVNSPEAYQRAIEYLTRWAPGLISRVQLYEGDIPLLEHYGVDEELRRSLAPEIRLPSGGTITIEETEALTAIDVNTGRFSKEEDPERMALLTNLEAAQEIARQMRLRDLAGLLLIDFIDMHEKRHMRKVVSELRHRLENERAELDIGRMSQFGVLEITRERTKASLLATMCEPCPACRGSGWILAREELCYRIRSFIHQRRSRLKGRTIELVVAPSVAHYLSLEQFDLLGSLAREYELSIRLRPDPELPISEFRVLE